jgi:hypothetical protein
MKSIFNMRLAVVSTIIITCIAGNHTIAQEKKVAPTSTALFNEIQYMDSVLFDAFNKRQMNKFKPLFSQELEWYQDNEGLLPYQKVFENFANTFKRDYVLTRQLVKGTLEVHPLKNYGAIEIGTHQFSHVENGRQETGTFKFVMLWKKENNQWKITRVISYDH